MFKPLNKLMILYFREWFESRSAATVHPEIRRWLDSADKLKQTIAKLKAVLKDKESKKPEPKKVEKKPEPEKKPIKPEDKDKKSDLRPEKSDAKPGEKKPEPKKPFVGPPEPKNGEKPTKIVKAKEKPEDDERGRNSDARFPNKVRD